MRAADGAGPFIPAADLAVNAVLAGAWKGNNSFIFSDLLNIKAARLQFSPSARL